MNQEHIRSYIEVVTAMLANEAGTTSTQMEVLSESQESIVLNESPTNIEQQLSNLVFKLKSYRNPEVSEYSSGTEAGMETAAQMLQNLINRIRVE